VEAESLKNRQTTIMREESKCYLGDETGFLAL
jgi:hypothetical protein